MNPESSLENRVATLVAGSGIEASTVKILGTEFARFYSVNSSSRVGRFMNEARGDSSAVVLEVPRLMKRPELDYKSAYATYQLLSAYRFVHELDIYDNMAPVVFASNAYFIHEGNLRSMEECRYFHTAEVDTRAGTVRTWIDSKGNVFKSDLVSLDYFERSQVAKEAKFLNEYERIDPESDLFPAVKYASHGRAVVELVRSMVPGRPLAQSDFGSSYLPNAFHSACLEYAKAGLFHNDLRPWNLLNDMGRIRMVDFADTSSRDADLAGINQAEAYIGTVLVLLGRLEVAAHDFVRVIHNVLCDARKPGWPSSPRDWAEIWLALPSHVDFTRFTAAWTLNELICDLMEQLIATDRRNHG